MSVDRQGHVFVSGWNTYRLSRWESATAMLDWSVATQNEGRGGVVTDDGDIWTDYSGPGLVVRRSHPGAFKWLRTVRWEEHGVSKFRAGRRRRVLPDCNCMV